MLQFITHHNQHFGYADGAAAVVAGGCRWVQLRMKDATRAELMETGLKIRDICRQAGATFIVDDHVELVADLDADGVHLGKNDMPVAEARQILGPDKIVGATANSFDDICAAVEAGADYIGLGPFRFTTTKDKLSPVLGLEGYRQIMDRCRREGITLPVVAIGGITADDLAPLMDTGIGGIAVSGALLNAADPAAETTKFLNLMQI